MVRKWIRWVGLVAFAIAVADGCGSGSGGSGQPMGDDAGEGGPGMDGSIETGGGSSGGGSSGSSGGSSSGGDDGSGPIDAALDISFPDGFTMPETGADTGGGDAGGDAAAEAGCMPNGVTCQGLTANTCNNGQLTMQVCPKMCVDGYGCVVCQPGTGSCNGNVGTACKDDGSGFTTNTCDPTLGETCDANTGRCDGDCANLPNNSNIGCEYWAVTMDNFLLNQNTFYFSVSLSNTSLSNTANIKITGPNATNISDTIPPGKLKEYKLPWEASLSCGVGPCCGDDQGCAPPPPGTVMQAAGAYHIKSTEPLTAYQFNARDYQIGANYSYTNDASLLIPVTAMTGNYWVAAYPTFYVWPGNIAIVATTNGTSVTVNAPANSLQAGGGLGVSGGTVTMNQGDVLQIASVLNSCGGQCYGTDISGTNVTATQPVEVFGGHSCVYTPANVGYCDHTEQINLPLETLRADYLVTLPWNDNGTPRQFVKIICTANGTALTYDPPQAGAAANCNAGQTTYFETTQHFHVTGNHPFEVGQYMEGEDSFSPSDTAGDPSLSIAVATAQFRDNYQFVAPANYAQNWVNVIAPSGATVAVDGVNVPNNQYTPIGASGYGVAHVSLCANNSCQNNGVHLVSGNKPFGIEVYGYGAYTSYMFPGGLNLARQ